VGISEQRIVAADGDRINFTWIDGTSGHKRKRMVLPEFSHEPGENPANEPESHRDVETWDFEIKVCCKCGGEMIIMGLYRNRRNIHDPEPNPCRVS